MTICSVFSRFFRNHNKVFIVMFPRMQAPMQNVEVRPLRAGNAVPETKRMELSYSVDFSSTF